MTAVRTVTPNTKVVSPVVIVNTTRGEYRMHAKTCADVRLDVKRAGFGSLWDDFTVGMTLGQYALETFGDIASDNFTAGTPEHAEEAWDNLVHDLNILPCAATRLRN